MKRRLGFVSNSSSSSFICDLCGEEYTSYDACISEAEMFECENGHTLCLCHAVGEIDTGGEYPYEVSEMYCPLCSFESVEDSTAVTYLLKELGKTEEQFLRELKSKFKNYDEYLEYLK